MTWLLNFARLSLVILLTGIVLVGCSLKLQVALFNNTGERVTVRTESKIIAIDAGQSAQFDYPGEEQNWTLQLSTAACDYAYHVPKTLDHYPRPSVSNGLLKAQVEGNFGVYLLPPTATVPASIAGLESLQQDGFPLRPTSSNCR